jgi:predicted small secreted protein
VRIVGERWCEALIVSEDRVLTPKEVPMRRINLMAAIGFTALLLAACHTTAGAGKDISAAGHAITHSANEHSY